LQKAKTSGIIAFTRGDSIESLDIRNILYTVATEAGKINAPIAFKGAAVLNHIFGLHDIPMRMTSDIDMSSDVTGSELDRYIFEIMRAFGSNFSIQKTGEPGAGRSAGYTVSHNGRIAFTMDVDNRLFLNLDIAQYRTPQGIPFHAVTLEQILIDKMTVLASPKCFRRIKDFIDIYRISLMAGIFVPDIDRLLKEDLIFDGFLNRMDDLKHALTKYRTDIALPEFEDMYARVYSFITPWIGPTVRYSSDRNYKWEEQWNHV